MTVHRRFAQRTLMAVAAIVAVVGCSSTSDDEAAQEQRLALEFVDALGAAGIAPRMTTGVAESLYGTDATAVCDAFDGGTTTSGDLILRGNIAHGRRQTITDDAVTYAGLVIQTYCPDVLADFEATVTDLDPFETNR